MKKVSFKDINLKNKLKSISKSKIVLAFVMVIYTIVSFINLGSTIAPQTFKTYNKDEYSHFKIPEDTKISKIKIYTGNCVTGDGNENPDLILYLYTYDDKWIQLNKNFAHTDKFRWNEIDTAYIWEDEENGEGRQVYLRDIEPCKSIVVAAYGDNNVVGELIAYDENGDIIDLQPDSLSDVALIDESNIDYGEPSNINCSYFDEIYYPNIAYELINNTHLEYIVHPPLGFLIISVPMYLFGATTFSYRLMGNIAGILIIFVMYHLGTLLFKKERYGAIAAIIMALDGMHFVQTRIATIDSFLLLFCLLAFFFMMKYVFLERKAPFKKKLLYLFLSGIFTGCAISTKWTAAFVILGMAIIFEWHYVRDIAKNGFNKKEDITLILCCIVFFIIIPFAIYAMSYIPLTFNDTSFVKDWDTFIEHQQSMMRYHAGLEATHPYTSSWYWWPMNYKPMLYYANYKADGTCEAISCMGTPVIWMVSILTAVGSLVYTIIKKEKECIPVLFMIVMTWLPYVFIGRIMFIYHYFIALPFMMLTIVFALKVIEEKMQGKQYVTVLSIVGFMINFIYFYPIFSGTTVSQEYFNNYYKDYVDKPKLIEFIKNIGQEK